MSVRTLPTIALCVLLASASLAPAADSSSPQGAVAGIFTALRNNDLTTLSNVVLNPGKRAEASQAYAAQMKEELDPEQTMQIDMVLGMLQAPGAEEMIVMMMEPQLAEAQMQLGQLSAMVGMMGGMMLASDPDMSDEDRQEAMAIAQAASQWLAGLKLTDPEKLQQAVALACAAVRQLGVNDAAGLRALSLDEALAKAGPVLAALKGITQLYGLDLDAILDDIVLGEPTIDGDRASVPVTVTFFGQSKTSPMSLQRHDGQWYPAADDDDDDDDDMD